MNTNVNNSSLIQDTNIALICDAENVSYKHMPFAVKTAKRMGVVKYLEAYACWSCGKSENWEKEAEENDIQLVDVKRVSTGTEAVDKSISYRLCTLSNKPDIHAIVLATSDSGFIDIISTMKKNGNILIGLGEDKTPVKYRREFDVFYNLTIGLYETKIHTLQSIPTTLALIYMLRKACIKAANSDGWAQLTSVGHYMKVQCESWQDSVGGLSLLGLVDYLGLFEVLKEENGNIFIKEQ